MGHRFSLAVMLISLVIASACRPRQHVQTLGSLLGDISPYAKSCDPDVPHSDVPEFISQRDAVECIAAHWNTVKAQPHQARYFTLTHLHNAGRRDRIRLYRDALTKLINSFAQEHVIFLPTPIDPAGSIFFFHTHGRYPWDTLADASPYTVHYSYPLARLISRRLAIPYVRGDWFVAAASVPPLYQEFIGFRKGHLVRWQKDFGFDPGLRFLANEVVRAGFDKFTSQISSNNRVIERTDYTHGAFWRSYDFKSSTDLRNIKRYPLGPCGQIGAPTCGKGEAMREHKTFYHDGSEIIYTLPNGLHAYLLVDERDRVIFEAPTSIVKDVNSPGGVIVNGRSCMGCHVPGILPAPSLEGSIQPMDQIRPLVKARPDLFEDAISEKILKVYASKSDFDRVVLKDQKSYRQALESMLLADYNFDPVSRAAKLYEKAPLSVDDVAAELDLTKDQLTAELEENPKLRARLQRLLVPGESIPRDLLVSYFDEMMEAVHDDIDGFSKTVGFQRFSYGQRWNEF